MDDPRQTMSRALWARTCRVLPDSHQWIMDHMVEALAEEAALASVDEVVVAVVALVDEEVAATMTMRNKCKEKVI
jgi:hypothetical protein